MKENCWDIFRKNKTILENVNEAVDMSNSSKSSDFEKGFALGAIKMEEIICEEFRKYRQVLPIQTKERWDSQRGCLL